MRQGRNPEFLFVDDKFVGVNLGADYCAEHEWGIKSIAWALQIGGNPSKNDSLIGLEKRKITKLAGRLSWCENVKVPVYQGFDKKKKTPQTWSGLWYAAMPMGDEPWFDGGVSAQAELYTAWNENSFCVFTNNPEKLAQLKKLYDAFQIFDVAIWTGGGGVFQNAGLCLAIASNIPPSAITVWENADNKRMALKRDMAATGIEKELKAAKKEYFALSPNYNKDGTLIFWLNPMEQDRNNFGWYTVKDLRDWIVGKGPIPKAKNGKR